MDDRVLLAHGGGGELTHRLISEHILPRLGNEQLSPLTDGALLDAPGTRLCVTTDASVVQPLEFPGGDIGRLAVAGTVNDLAVMGARPLALTQTLIIEEGLPFAQLDRILDSIAATAAEAGVQVVAGDTKVIERRGGDGLMISTSGLGLCAIDPPPSPERIQPSDVLIISGSLADHGLAIMAQREGLAFETSIRSDVAPLAGLCHELFHRHGDDLRFLRDPTRGGLAGVLADCACRHSLHIDEEALPINPATRHAAEMLGLDPLSVANEGKVLIVCAAEAAEAVLATCRSHIYGRQAAIIGSVVEETPPLAELITSAGGRRIIQRPYGEELPRIC